MNVPALIKPSTSADMAPSQSLRASIAGLLDSYQALTQHPERVLSAIQRRHLFPALPAPPNLSRVLEKTEGAALLEELFTGGDGTEGEDGKERDWPTLPASTLSTSSILAP